MGVLILRHASAGSRKAWAGDDIARPLDAKGLRQARELAESLRHYPIERIVSSPFERCIATVRPLAVRLGLEIETRSELAEAAGAAAPRALLRELGPTPALLCTHGDVIEALVGPERSCAKGAAWLLENDGNGYAPAVYVPAS